MNTKLFPLNGQYQQTNRSNVLGTLWSTMGIDLQSNLGVLRVTPRLKVNTSTADSANLGLPIAFESADSRLWAICGTRVFKNTGGPSTAFAEDASVGASTSYNVNGDLETYNGLLWSFDATQLYSKVLNGAGTGAWTAVGSTVGSVPHVLVNFTKFNRLYYQANQGVIYSVNTSSVVASSGDYTLTLDTGAEITCMKATSTAIFMGISANSSSFSPPAFVLQWDGISAQVTNKFLLKSRYVVAMVILDSVPYVMDGDGVLSAFDGSTFSEVGRLPFTTLLPLPNYMTKNSMIITKNNTIQVLINNVNYDVTSSTYENIPSGIWEWSRDNGFVHKYSFTYNPAANSTITDYGQNRISAAGALYDASNIFPNVAGANGTLLAGATYYTDATTTTNAIFLDDSNNTVQKKGYFVTEWFNSEEIEDKWIRLYQTFRRLLGATDSLVFKYRTNEEDPTYATITWTSTTTFTTTTDISAYAPGATGFSTTSGGEVEIIQGTGGASCAHITAVVNNAGTYTVTLDSVITGVTGTAKARFQKWIKLFPEVTGQIKSSAQQSIGTTDYVRFQLKGCLTFTGNGEFYKAAIVSNSDQTINP